MPLGRLFKRKAGAAPEAQALYWRAVEQARSDVFYAETGVPDTLDGRFEMIALHVFLVLERLKGGGEEASKLSQDVFDAMFVDMDRSLREMGAGDLGVGPRVKKMAQALYGRIAAYESGLASDEPLMLPGLLRRNLYGTCESVEEAHLLAMAGYLRRQHAALESQPTDALLKGEIRFLPARAVMKESAAA